MEIPLSFRHGNYSRAPRPFSKAILEQRGISARLSRSGSWTGCSDWAFSSLFCYFTPVLCRNPPTGPLKRSLPASQVLALCKWQMVRPCRLPIILAGCKLPECSVSLAKEEMEPTLEFVQWQLWDWHIRAQFPFIHQRRSGSHCFLALIMSSPEMGKCQTLDIHHKQWLARKPTGYECLPALFYVGVGPLFFSGLQQRLAQRDRSV